MLLGWFYGKDWDDDAKSCVTSESIAGGSNLAQVIKLKISKTLGCFFPIAWNFVTPLLLALILAYNALFFKEPLFRNIMPFPLLLHLTVVGLAISFLILIPIVGYHQIMRTPRGNFFIVSSSWNIWRPSNTISYRGSQLPANRSIMKHHKLLSYQILKLISLRWRNVVPLSWSPNGPEAARHQRTKQKSKL